ncbi:MAG: hypothetical protein JWQ27_2036 [Ferruginibacter sp.]|nr:hypothetical protein [Ferruginibacter sp.]
MKKIILAAIVLFTIGLMSCQKEYTQEDSLITTNDSNQLYKIITIDSNRVDTAYITYYKYDAQERISSIIIHDRQSMPDSTVYEFSYASLFDSMASSIRYLNNATPTSVDYYNYDSQGRMTKDSAVGYNVTGTPQPVLTFVYNYTNSGILEFTKRYLSTPPYGLEGIDTSKIHPVYSNNNNIVSQKDTTRSAISVFNRIQEWQVVYDNHTNIVPRGFPVQSFLSFSDKYTDEFYQPRFHNITRLTIIDDSSFPFNQYDNTVIYDSVGRLKALDNKYNWGGAIYNGYKYFYFYR